ncbi:MAG: branched-chain amino acid transporter permease protein [Actinomycetia bacterium]|nr:branched-chain amino acid transporter permease protein [Actinomycetes bacterium]
MVTTLLTGVATGAIYALVAMGLNLAYLSSKVFNFAHAQFVMLGALLSATLVERGWPWPLALLLAALTPASVAWIEELFVVRLAARFGAEGHSALVSTLGFGVLIQASAGLRWGEDPRTMPFAGRTEPVQVGSGYILPVQLAVVVAAVVAVVVFEVLSRRTRHGLRYLAIAEDPAAAQLRGINAKRMVTTSFVVAGGLAGAVGFLIAPITSAFPELGSLLVLKAFVAMAVGGFGSQAGAVVGGITLGLAEAVGAYQFGGGYPNVLAFGLLLVVLLVRPTGLFGRRDGRLV